jgi:hypothetical protein
MHNEEAPDEHVLLLNNGCKVYSWRKDKYLVSEMYQFSVLSQNVNFINLLVLFPPLISGW